MSDARDALALSLLPGIGPVRCRELLTAHGTPTRAWLAVASGTAASRALRDAEAALARAKHIGARVLAADSVDYPAPLHELPDPPAALFALGDATLLSRPSVAIVGTRSASAYGERIAELLGAALARAGATVVSGMARGVDAAAHRGALAAGGATAAV
ncbi:MAG: DNA-processing protein DprA, partial [Gemmatimonadaceae bacterium]